MKYNDSLHRFTKESTFYTIKDYSSLSDDEFNHLLNIYMILSSNEIYPEITVNGREIRCARIQPLRNEDDSGMISHPNLLISQLEKKIDQKISLMHSLDLAHGDLCIFNIGYIGNEIYFMNVEYTFEISKGMTKDVKDLMDTGFEWEGTFDEFVLYDFNNWKFCLDREEQKLLRVQPVQEGF